MRVLLYLVASFLLSGCNSNLANCADLNIIHYKIVGFIQENGSVMFAPKRFCTIIARFNTSIEDLFLDHKFKMIDRKTFPPIFVDIEGKLTIGKSGDDAFRKFEVSRLIKFDFKVPENVEKVALIRTYGPDFSN